MATTRKAARRSTSRRAGGKLERAPKHGTVRARAARPHTKRGARPKPGTLRGRSRTKTPRKAGARQSEPRRRQQARAMFGERLLDAAENTGPNRAGTETGDAGSPSAQNAPTYYTGEQPPAVAEPGPATTGRNSRSGS